MFWILLTVIETVIVIITQHFILISKYGLSLVIESRPNNICETKTVTIIRF